MKRCARCNVEQPPSAFCVDRQRADGLHLFCRTCAAERAKGYREKNKARADSSATPRARRCPQCDTVKSATDFTRNRSSKHGLSTYCRTCSAARCRDYHAANRDRARVQQHEYYLENTALVRERTRAYREANIERARAREAEWKREHPDAVRAGGERRRSIKAGATVRGVSVGAREIEWRRQMFGGCCYICGSADARAMDHVIALARGGLHVPANLRPICMRCNSRKHAKDWRAFVSAA